MSNSSSSLHVRWLGRVPYCEALALQLGLFEHGVDQHLLLLEHPHVFTYGHTADLANNLRCEPVTVGAELVQVQRGGDITYHGPGQLVGYPILSLQAKHGIDGPADTRSYIYDVEQLIIDTLTQLGVHNSGRMGEFPGVWLDPNSDKARKICAIGVRVGSGSTDRRTMHGFALNISTDMTFMREHIVPCGIADYAVTSLVEEGIDVSMNDVVDIVARLTQSRWGSQHNTRADVAWKHSPQDLSAFSRGEGAGEPVRMIKRLEQAGVTDGLSISVRKPEWIRPHVQHTDEVLKTKRTLRDLNLVTVCEQAGCPNLSECWNDGTATFMVLGERCTRACGFCLIDTQKPLLPDVDEPRRVAEAVQRMGLEFAVLTMVARDDLIDGGMQHVVDTVRAIRTMNVSAKVETLISDVKGTDALDILIAERPDVFNHNIETVARLQRAVRPSAGYARSLSVLARGRAAGLTTKSGMIVGMGETRQEVEATLIDLASVGVQIVTIGQYLRPTTHHLPVARFVEPQEFDHYKAFGESLGMQHVQSSPLTRSSFHAKHAHGQSQLVLHA
ncbi:MAG: lipoyl synthase [Actinomycetota bacterium]